MQSTMFHFLIVFIGPHGTQSRSGLVPLNSGSTRDRVMLELADGCKADSGVHPDAVITSFQLEPNDLFPVQGYVE